MEKVLKTVSATGSIPVSTDSIQLLFDSVPSVIETDDKGVPVYADGALDGVRFYAKATVKAVQGNLPVEVDSVSVSGTLHCKAVASGTTVYLVQIESETSHDDTFDQDFRIYKTNGYVDITAKIGKETYGGRWAWSLEYSRYMATFWHDSLKFGYLMKEWKTDSTGKLMTFQSVIEQTTNSIQLQVKDDYKSAGIDISSGNVVLQGGKISVMNGDKQAALFVDGKLNADLLEIRHLYSIDEQGNRVGHFGDGVAMSDAAKTSVPLWVGSDTPDGATFRVSDKGDLFSVSGNIGPFYISRTSLYTDKKSPRMDRLTLDNSGISFVDMDETMYVGLGPRSISQATGVSPALFIDYDGKGTTVTNVGILINTRGTFDGARYENYAIWMQGGYIGGLAVRPLYIQGNVTFERGVNSCVFIGDGTLTIPQMRQQDDGYVLMVKTIHGGLNQDRDHVAIGGNNGAIIDDNPYPVKRITLSSCMDAMILVYYHYVTNSGMSGIWVQWKCPRNW